MIRNLLYSVFLHILIIFAIYFGIETVLLDNEENNTHELLVSIASQSKTDKPKPDKKVNKINKPKPVVKVKKPPKIKDFSPNIKKVIINPKINKAINTAKRKFKNSIKSNHELVEFDPEKIYLPDNNDDDIDSLLLSTVHKRAIKSQLNFCFQDILKGQDITKNIVKKIEVSFEMSNSGVLLFNISNNFDEKLLKDDDYYNFNKIIKKIDLNTKKCAIFRNLPKNRYQSWKEFKVLFK